MPEISTLAVFVIASLALLVVPGPAVLYIVTRSVEGGRVAGLASALGVGIGGLIHVIFAAVGLSALLASSAIAFSVVKWLGAAYLVWLGLSRLLGGDEHYAPAPAEERSLSGIFWQGALVNVLNPKAALFFLAFVPQFVDPVQGPAWVQILVLGLTFVAMALCTDALYALLSGTAGGWLRRSGARFRRWQRYVTGTIYIALGAATAVSGSGKD